MVRLVVLLAAAALVSCATSEPTSIDAPIDSAVIDAIDGATDDAPDARDAAIDAIDAPGGPDACVPTTEVCNGTDDDCDLMIDDGFPTLGMTCTSGVGACARPGLIQCNGAGTGVACSATAGMPAAEACNGADDDCDNATDEGLGLGTPCDGADSDLCVEGAIVCAANGTTTCGDVSGNNTEACNAQDDDCDTRTDEGFNLGALCDGADTDACQEGTIVCAGNGTATCGDATGNNLEQCNGLDDDCQGGIDNGFAVGAACTVGVGLCARTGTNVCNGAGTGVVCSVSPGSPSAEICGDGIDQDCSGADVTCPSNDGPTGALNISGGGTFTVDLTSARNDQDFSGAECGSTGGRDVYYTFTLPAAEVVYLDTVGSNFDTVLRVFAGSCPTPGALQACSDDPCGVQSQRALSLAAGTYCVVADQYSSGSTLGSLVVNFTRGGRTGTAIAASSGTQAGTSCSGVNASVGSCQTFSTAQDAAYYFTLCPSITRAVTASTCTGTAFDSVVYLRGGSALSTDLGCDDDACPAAPPDYTSAMPTTTIFGPGLFWLVVDGYQAACGNYTLTYTIN